MTPKEKIIVIRDIFHMTNKGIGEILGHTLGVSKRYFDNSVKHEFSELHVKKITEYIKRNARNLK